MSLTPQTNQTDDLLFAAATSDAYIGNTYPARLLVKNASYRSGSLQRRVGERVLDTIAANFAERPAVKEPRVDYVPKRFNKDMNLASPQRSIVFSDPYRIGRESLSVLPDKGLYSAMKQAGQQYANELITTGRVSGWAVLTDQHRAAFTRDKVLGQKYEPGVDRLMGSSAVDNLIYRVHAFRRDDGTYHVTAVPQGLNRALVTQNSFSKTVDETIAKRLVGAFSPITGDRAKIFEKSSARRKLVRTQAKIIEGERAWGAISKLRDPNVFAGLVYEGKFPGSGDSSVKPRYNQAFIHDVRRRVDQVLSPLASSEHNASAIAAERAFRAGAMAAWERHADRIGADPHDFESKEFQTYYKRKWALFYHPVMQRVRGEVNMPYSPSGSPAYVLSGRVFDEENRRKGLLRAIEDRARQVGLGTSQGDEWFDLTHPGELGPSTPKDEISHVRQRLRMLDELEEGNPLYLHSRKGRYKLLNQREAMFGRFRMRIDNMVDEANMAWDDSLKKMVNRGRFQVRYTFHEAEPLNGRGYRVVAHIAGADAAGIRKGDMAQGAQIEFPIVDLDGRFTTAGGQRLVAGNLGVSGDVMRNAGLAPWNNSIESVSQGLVRIQDKMIHIEGGGSDVYVATPQQAIMGMMDKRVGRALKKLKRGRFDQVVSEFSRTMMDLKELGIAATDNGMQESDVWRYGISMPNQFVNDVFNFSAMDKHLINHTKLQMFADGRIDLDDLTAEDVKLPANASREAITKRYLSLVRQGKMRPVVLFDRDKNKGISNQVRAVRTSVVKRLLKQTNGDAERAEALMRTGFVDMVDNGNAVFKMMEPADKRSRLGYLLNAMHGRDAEGDERLIPLRLFQNIQPGGWANVRPLQAYKSFPIPGGLDGVSDVAKTQWVTHDGEWKKFGDARYGRNLSTGFILNGQMLDEMGNPTGGLLDGEEAGRIVGAYEQQMLIHPDAQREFGSKANLQGQKLIAGGSKGTLQVAGTERAGGYAITKGWDDDTIQLFSGVIADKTVGKHEQIGMIQNGMLQRIVAEAGPHRKAVAERLRELLPDAQIVGDDGVSALQLILPEGAALPNIHELMKLGDMANISFVKDVVFETSGGALMKAQALNVLLHTRPIYNSSWTTRLNAKERMFNNRLVNPLGNRTSEARMGILDLMRMDNDGLGPHARNIATAIIKDKQKSGELYELTNALSAYIRMSPKGEKGRPSDMGLAKLVDAKRTTVEEMAALGRGETLESGLTHAEYEKRYRQGLRQMDLGRSVGLGDGHTVSHIMLPDEVGRMVDGAYRPSPLQSAADSVIREFSTDPKSEEATESVKRYWNKLSEEVGGKQGRMADIFKSAEFSGWGMAKGMLGTSGRVVGDNELPAFTVAISREQAERMGSYEPRGIERPTAEGTARYFVGATPSVKNTPLAEWRAKNEKQGFFWGTFHRQPLVTPGRTAVQVIVDPHLVGDTMLLHESVADVSIGDFDGDNAALFQAGPLEGLNLSKEEIAATQDAVKEQTLLKRSIFETMKQKKAAEASAGLELANPLFARQKIGKYLPDNTALGEHLVGLLGTDEGANDQAVAGYAQRGSKWLHNMVMQRRTSKAQGIMGSIIDPMQIYAMKKEQEAMLAGDFESQAKWNMRNKGFGWLREELLKIKSKQELPLDALFRGFKGEGKPSRMNFDGITIEDLDHRARISERGAKDPLYDPHEFAAAYQESFIEKYKTDPIKMKRYQEAFTAINEWQNEMGPGFLRSKEFKEITGSIYGATKGQVVPQKSLLAGVMDVAKFITGGAIPKGMNEQYMTWWKQAMEIGVEDRPEQALRNKLIKQRIKYGAAVQAAQDMAYPEPSYENVGAIESYVDQKLAPALSHLTSPSQSTLEKLTEAAAVSEEMLAPAEVPSSELGKIASTTAHDTMEAAGAAARHSKPARWALAALGAGAVLGVGAFVTGGGSSAAPEMPARTGGDSPPARVMSTDPGGSEESYNIRVRAKGSKDDDQSQYGSAFGGIGPGSLTINVRDSRTGIADHMHHHFTDQMKGRG